MEDYSAQESILDMKTIQKLEIAGGLATLLSALLQEYFTVFAPMSKQDVIASPSIEQAVFHALIIIAIPALTVAVGSFTHAVWQSKIDLVLVFVGGVTVMSYFGMLFFALVAFSGYSLFSILLIASPGFFAAGTAYLALHQTAWFSAPTGYVQ